VNFDDEQRQRKQRMRAATVVGCVLVVYLAVVSIGAFALFAVAGAVIVLVYVFDVPQLLFSGVHAARKKVQGVEHAGRHDWYGFHGSTIRVFFDERRNPWMAAKEIAHILALGDVPEAFRGYRTSEFAKQPFAKDEYCFSEAGLRRLLKQSQHPEAHAMLLWLEREVLFPLQRREEKPIP
jgi:BRO family protein